MSPGLTGYSRRRPVHPAHGGRDDVVEVLLAAAVPLHRVEAKLHRRHVVLAVGAADDLVDRSLDRERRALDELGPVEQLEVAVERAVPPRRDGDHVAELPVVLGRELDPLRVGDPPHDRRGHGAAEMAVELRERDLARERTRHAPRIAEAVSGRSGRSGPELDVPRAGVLAAALVPARPRWHRPPAASAPPSGAANTTYGVSPAGPATPRIVGGDGHERAWGEPAKDREADRRVRVSITPRPVARGRNTGVTVRAALPSRGPSVATQASASSSGRVSGTSSDDAEAVDRREQPEPHRGRVAGRRWDEA